MNKNQSALEEFKKEIVQEVRPDQFANKFLSKRLWQYRKIRLGRGDNRLVTLADVYRNIELFLDEVCDTLEELRQEIINEVEGKPTEIFFPEIARKLILEDCDTFFTEEDQKNISVMDSMFIEIQDMETNKDWSNALEQTKRLKREKEKNKK